MRAVIVGAGLLGLTTAYYLKQQGAEVTVIDRENGVALETSFANAGLITPGMASPWNSPGVFTQLLKSFFDSNSPVLLRPSAIPGLMSWGLQFLIQSKDKNYLRNSISISQLATYNLTAMDEIDQQLQLSYSCKQGTIMIFRKSEEFTAVKKDIDRLRPYGINYTSLNNSEITQHEPALKPIEHELAGGMYFTNDRFGDAYQFCNQLYQALISMGVEFKFNQAIDRINCSKNTVGSILCGDSVYTADKFVIAAGSYSTPLLKQTGIALPVAPVKGYSLSVPFLDNHPAPQYSIIDFHLHAALTPLANILRIGGTAEFSGFDTTMHKKRVLNLINLLHHVYPAYKTSIQKPEDARPWVGLRPMTPTGVPIVSRSDRYDNLFINTGHGHMGWSLAAGSGKLLADIMQDRQTDINASVYSLSNK